jgi:hypothetical protein
MDFEENDAKEMDIMAKFNSHKSTYDGEGNRQKGDSIFLSGHLYC